jgi:hypothetical protein
VRTNRRLKAKPRKSLEQRKQTTDAKKQNISNRRTDAEAPNALARSTKTDISKPKWLVYVTSPCVRGWSAAHHHPTTSQRKPYLH